jgi:hypothetical protein
MKSAGMIENVTRMLRAMKGWRALAGLGVLTLVLVFAADSVMATHGRVEKWRAWYEGEEVSVLMYPVGHKNANPHFQSGCVGTSPVDPYQPAEGLPIFYVLFIPGADDMYCHADGGSGWHDMVATAVPGDPDYNPLIQLRVCVPGEAFVPPKKYTSEREIIAAEAANELMCRFLFDGDEVPNGVRLAPVVQGPTTRP